MLQKLRRDHNGRFVKFWAKLEEERWRNDREISKLNHGGQRQDGGRLLLQSRKWNETASMVLEVNNMLYVLPCKLLYNYS